MNWSVLNTCVKNLYTPSTSMVLLWALLITGVGSCGPRSSTNAMTWKMQKGVLTPGEDPFSEEQTLACTAYDGQCPKAVGRLLTVYADRSFGSCTGFLVSPKIVMTNTHCVQGLSSKEYCERSRFIVRTGEGLKTRQLRCSEVLLTHTLKPEETHNDNDYAFIQLEKATEIAPLVIENEEGVVDAKSYSIWSIDSRDAVMGRVVKRECEAVHRSFVLPHFEDRHSAIVAFVNCPIISGNSGSPVMNESGQAVAIVYAGNNQENAHQNPILKGVRVSLAVNFSCVLFPQIASFNAKNCQAPDFLGASQRIKKEASGLLLQELAQAIEVWSGTANTDNRQLLEWAPLALSQKSWTVTPRCLKTRQDFKQSIILPKWSLKSITNRRLIAEPKLRAELPLEALLRVYPGDSWSRQQLVSIDGIDGIAAIVENIPLCEGVL